MAQCDSDNPSANLKSLDIFKIKAKRPGKTRWVQRFRSRWSHDPKYAFCLLGTIEIECWRSGKTVDTGPKKHMAVTERTFIF